MSKKSTVSRHKWAFLDDLFATTQFQFTQLFVQELIPSAHSHTCTQKSLHSIVSPHRKGGVGECREWRVSFTVMWIIKLEGCTLFWSTKFPDVFLEIMYRILKFYFFFMVDKHLRNSRPTIPHNFSHAKPQAVNHFSLQMPRVNPKPVHRGSVVDRVALGQVFLQVL
jgi:hypothetical protein